MLLLIGIVATSSVKPGYDENGEDIDECALYEPCPEGYMCRNLLGSYLCEGSGMGSENLTLDDVAAGGIYSVSAECSGLGTCTAVCHRCLRSYSAPVIGKAYLINGFCICGSMSFKGL